jgi:hypothetical protein
MLSPPPAHFLLGAEPGTVKRGLATLTGILAVTACAPRGGFPLLGGPRRPQKPAPQHDLARSPRSEAARRKINPLLPGTAHGQPLAP